MSEEEIRREREQAQLEERLKARKSMVKSYRELRQLDSGHKVQSDQFLERPRSATLLDITDANTLKFLMKDSVLAQRGSYLDWCHYPLDSYQKKFGEVVDEWTGDKIPVYVDQERVCGLVLQHKGPRAPKIRYCDKHQALYEKMLNRERVRRFEQKHNHE